VSKTKARGDQQRDLPINRQTSTTAEPSAPQGLKLISLIVAQLLPVTSVSGTSSPTRTPNRIRSMVRLISMQWLAEIARDGKLGCPVEQSSTEQRLTPALLRTSLICSIAFIAGTRNLNLNSLINKKEWMRKGFGEGEEMIPAKKGSKRRESGRSNGR
jgi:hypothetical protein